MLKKGLDCVLLIDGSVLMSLMQISSIPIVAILFGGIFLASTFGLIMMFLIVFSAFSAISVTSLSFFSTEFQQLLALLLLMSLKVSIDLGESYTLPDFRLDISTFSAWSIVNSSFVDLVVSSYF